VSRVVRRLEALGLVERDEQRAVRASDPKLLLDAWAEVYEFQRHHQIRGHVAARSGEELLARISRACSRAGIEHAATGLAGAWLLTHFAAFRVVTCYVADLPPRDVLDGLGFHDDERGANVWLALPSDEGVFLGVEERDRIPCVHPIQVWLDLKGHPERAGEAARHLEETLLDGRARAGCGVLGSPRRRVVPRRCRRFRARIRAALSRGALNRRRREWVPRPLGLVHRRPVERPRGRDPALGAER
jgi:hypothetical protein